jgi:hypothetical protein
MERRSHIYGVVAEFPTPHELIQAVEKIAASKRTHLFRLRGSPKRSL